MMENLMNNKILITYATTYGATKEIASRIGDVLSQAGLHVDVMPVDQVRDVTAYPAVILGSGVYIGQWNKAAASFLKANEKALTGRCVWLFSSGPTGEGDPVDLLQGWHLPSSLQPVAERINPRGITVFHGYINPQKISFSQKFIIKNMLKKPFGDFRDWKMIDGWARTIATELELTQIVQ
jgi:menaquinone-dependent protoporphyrinogen oxidase